MISLNRPTDNKKVLGINVFEYLHNCVEYRNLTAGKKTLVTSTLFAKFAMSTTVASGAYLAANESQISGVTPLKRGQFSEIRIFKIYRF